MGNFLSDISVKSEIRKNPELSSKVDLSALEALLVSEFMKLQQNFDDKVKMQRDTFNAR